MTDRQKFVAACEAVCDADEPDPVPLIAFADWLDERGDPARLIHPERYR